VETLNAPAAVAVEPPTMFANGRRRRPVVAIAGIALGVSMFLPMLESSRLPIEIPALALVYLCGFAFALIGATRSARGLRAGVNLLRVIALAIAVAGSIVMFWQRAVGIMELLFGLVLLVAIGVYEITEQRAAAATAMFGGIAAMGFGMFAGSGDALVGPYVTEAAAIALLLGGTRWLLATTVVGRDVPIAHARYDRPR